MKIQHTKQRKLQFVTLKGRTKEKDSQILPLYTLLQNCVNERDCRRAYGGASDSGTARAAAAAATVCAWSSCWYLRRARNTSLTRVAGTHMPTRDSAVVSVVSVGAVLVVVLLEVFDLGDATREAFAGLGAAVVVVAARDALRFVGDLLVLM